MQASGWIRGSNPETIDAASQRGPVDNRAARRKAAAARSARARPKQAPGSPTSIAPRRGEDRQAAGQRPPASAGVEPEALVVTHWFDSGEEGEPYSAVVRLTGRRVDIRGTPRSGDTFSQEETVDGIVPGSGPVSISTWVYGLEPGEWTVNAEVIRPMRDGVRSRHASAEPLQRAAWSWRRWALSTGPATAVKTRWALPAPLARIPGVVPGSFTVMAVLGVLVALIVQAAILAHENVSVGPSLVVWLFALVAGLVAAKLWYAVLHPGPWRQAIMGGWAVDGFLVVATGVAVAMLFALDLPVGAFLDAAAPGIFFAVAIGRLGCFFTGCCAGRCTRSRWGVWSSDRRVGARRIPTQLLESATGLLIGAIATLLVLGHALGVAGIVFVAAFAVYALVRQFLLRIRAESRKYSWLRRSAVAAGRS